MRSLLLTILALLNIMIGCSGNSVTNINLDKAHAYMFNANAMVIEQQHKKAARLYASAYEIYQSQNQTEYAHTAKLQSIQSLITIGRFSKALNLLENTIAYYVEKNNNYYKYLQLKAYVSWQLEDNATANELIEYLATSQSSHDVKFATAVQKTQMLLDETKANTNLRNILKWYNYALDHKPSAEHANAKFADIRLLRLKASIAMVENKFELADTLFQKALFAYQVLGHSVGIAATLEQLATLSELRNNQLLTNNYLNQALQIRDFLGDSLRADRINKQLGNNL